MSDDTLHHVVASDNTLRTIRWALRVAGQSSNPDDRANCQHVGGVVDEWLSRAPEGIVGVTILVEPDPNVESRLEEFEIRQAEDDEGDFTDKLDLELHHSPCGSHLCDVEHDDTLRVLLSVARSHTCPHPDTTAHEASEEDL
jgi:hypothetical protein